MEVLQCVLQKVLDIKDEEENKSFSKWVDQMYDRVWQMYDRLVMKKKGNWTAIHMRILVPGVEGDFA